MSSVEQRGEPTSPASRDEATDTKLEVMVREQAGQELPS